MKKYTLIIECPCCGEEKRFSFNTLVELSNFISKWDKSDKYTDMTTIWDKRYRYTETD